MKPLRIALEAWLSVAKAFNAIDPFGVSQALFLKSRTVITVLANDSRLVTVAQQLLYLQPRRAGAFPYRQDLTVARLG